MKKLTAFFGILLAILFVSVISNTADARRGNGGHGFNGGGGGPKIGGFNRGFRPHFNRPGRFGGIKSFNPRRFGGFNNHRGFGFRKFGPHLGSGGGNFGRHGGWNRGAFGMNRGRGFRQQHFAGGYGNGRKFWHGYDRWKGGKGGRRFDDGLGRGRYGDWNKFGGGRDFGGGGWSRPDRGRRGPGRDYAHGNSGGGHDFEGGRWHGWKKGRDGDHGWGGDKPRWKKWGDHEPGHGWGKKRWWREYAHGGRPWKHRRGHGWGGGWNNNYNNNQNTNQNYNYNYNENYAGGGSSGGGSGVDWGGIAQVAIAFAQSGGYSQGFDNYDSGAATYYPEREVVREPGPERCFVVGKDGEEEEVSCNEKHAVTRSSVDPSRGVVPPDRGSQGGEKHPCHATTEQDCVLPNNGN